MTEEEFQRARSYYQTFLETQRLLESISNPTIGRAVWQPVVEEINSALTDLPGIMRPFRMEDISVGRAENGPVLSTAGLRQYVGVAAARLKVELDGGARRFTSEVLADFVGLAREVLAEPGDSAKNVAAVLTAAAYEDTLRRMAGGAGPERKLAEVIEDLKKSGVLVSPQLGIAQSFLKFRNQALHAEWATIERGAVESVLALVQDLLLTHFGG